MATFAVGDIQGCFEPFQRLLRRVKFNADRDILWSVGDLVNRGPDNLQTLRWFHAHRDNCVVVLGNHDLHLLAVSSGARNANSSDTFQDILKAADRDILVDWLQKLPLAHNKNEITMVHAGIPPTWTVRETLARAREVEETLRGPSRLQFLEAMYGNYPHVWSEDLSGLTRLRTITNYLTRMRYCTKNGQLDLISKGSPPDSKKMLGEKMAPWFSHKNRLSKDDIIIFGHWASLGGLTNTKKIIGLDTGCVWGKCLTIYNMDTGERTHCGCHG